MSILLKEYIREYDQQSIYCKFNNDKNLFYNVVYNKYEGTNVPSIEKNLLATFDYSGWNVEVYNNVFNTLFNNNYNFLITKSKIVFVGNKDLAIGFKCGNIVDKFNNKISNLNDGKFIFPQEYLKSQEDHFYIEKIADKHNLYYNDLLILSYSDYIVMFEDLQFIYSPLLIEKLNFFIRYENEIISNECIEIYNNLPSLNFDISSDNKDPHLMISYPNKNAYHLLSHSNDDNNKEEYYIISDKNKQESIVIANISYDCENDCEYFVFSVGFAKCYDKIPNILLNNYENFQIFDLRDNKIILRKLKIQVDLPYIDTVKLSNSDNKMQELIRQLTISDTNVIDMWKNLKNFIEDVIEIYTGSSFIIIKPLCI